MSLAGEVESKLVSLVRKCSAAVSAVSEGGVWPFGACWSVGAVVALVLGIQSIALCGSRQSSDYYRVPWVGG
jgi:hypothetical protein